MGYESIANDVWTELPTSMEEWRDFYYYDYFLECII